VTARSRKVLGDLRADKTRTALVALAIAVGVMSLGMVIGARQLMRQTLSTSAREGAFANASFRTDSFGAPLLARVRSVRGVEGAEGRRVVYARISTGPGEWDELTLTAVPDYERMTIDKIHPQRGSWPPPFGSLLVERDSLAHLDTAIGRSVLLELPDGTSRRVQIAGTVHDLSSPSTSTSGIPYGYASFATLRRLGDHGGFNELDIRTDPDLTRRQVERIASSVRAVIEQSGRTVSLVTVPKPGKFWADDAVQSMVMLLSVLAVVCLLMSALLVVNIVSALLARQVRQVGVMKAIGASMREAAALYLAMSTVFGVVALAIAIPLGALGALFIVHITTQLIDIDAPPLSVPPSVLAIEVAVALVLPALAALGPVVAASRTTVRDALSRDAGGPAVSSAGVVERLTPLPASARLSLRNTVRARRRLALTLVALVVGGSVFVALVSVRASLARTLDAEESYRKFDVQIGLDRPYRVAGLAGAAAGPGVAETQAWAGGSAYRVRDDGSESQTLALVGLPPRTKLVEPLVVSGRWLAPTDRRAVVVNTDVLRTEPEVYVGSDVVLSVKGREVTWRVVGVVKAILTVPTIYGNVGTIAAATGERGQARTLAVVLTKHDGPSQERLGHAVAARLESAGFRVGTVQTSAAVHSVDASNFEVISSFLMSMAILIAAVAGLGLMGTLGVNVIERSREIGIMRALGAGNGAVMRLVLAEGLLIALLAWLVATPLTIPLSKVLSKEVGNLFIGTPLVYSFPAVIPFVWLAIVLAIALFAGSAPAYRAAHMTVRDALSYE